MGIRPGTVKIHLKHAFEKTGVRGRYDLAIGGLKKEPVVMTDAQGNDSIAIRWMQNFCLGFDHRTIDGADSGKFMSEFKKALETWERPIL